MTKKILGGPVINQTDSIMSQDKKHRGTAYWKYYLFVKMADPFSKLTGIWNSCRKEHIMYIIRKQNNSLFPNHATF